MKFLGTWILGMVAIVVGALVLDYIGYMQTIGGMLVYLLPTSFGLSIYAVGILEE